MGHRGVGDTLSVSRGTSVEESRLSSTSLLSAGEIHSTPSWVSVDPLDLIAMHNSEQYFFVITLRQECARPQNTLPRKCITHAPFIVHTYYLVCVARHYVCVRAEIDVPRGTWKYSRGCSMNSWQIGFAEPRARVMTIIAATIIVHCSIHGIIT